MTVALIMAARNEEQSASLTLDSVFASSRLPDEIVVGDGMSTDRTVERILRYSDRGVRLHVVPNEKILPGAGRNVAVDASTAEILLLLDFGNTIDPCWIEEMVRPFECDDRLELVGGIFVPDVRSEFEACVAAIQFHRQLGLLDLPPDERRALLPGKPAPGGLSIGFTRAAWDRVGGMPDWLRAAEDKLFGRKLMATNPRWYFNPKAVLFHHMRGTPQQIYHQMWTYFRGEGRTGRIDLHVLKLFVFYLLQLGMLASSVYWWPGAALGAGSLVLYVYLSGVRKVRVGSALARTSAWRLAPRVLFPRDAGIIAGQIAGLADWIFRPMYRRKLWEYQSGATSVRA